MGVLRHRKIDYTIAQFLQVLPDDFRLQAMHDNLHKLERGWSSLCWPDLSFHDTPISS